MVCTYCGGETEVINSRHQKRNNNVWRRRRCANCLSVFTTHEAADLSNLLKVRGKTGLEPFVSDKLYAEVLLALQDRKNCYTEARELVSTITQKLLKQAESPIVSTKQISRATEQVLKSFNRRAWQRYSLEHPSLQG